VNGSDSVGTASTHVVETTNYHPKGLTSLLLSYSLTPCLGVRFSASGQRWEQSGDVTITVPGAESCGTPLAVIVTPQKLV
jgi:hypothetical protein